MMNIPSTDSGRPHELSTDNSDLDHRKKRRNRMTQSCLNCHNSKRKCDRKRPWCQRCVLLGLTGLCVYEVDDLSTRDDVNADENTRLKKRIADLESLVRQMKGKPEPRWADTFTREDDPQGVWHSRASKRRASSPDVESYPPAKSARHQSSVKTERPPDDVLLSQQVVTDDRFKSSPPVAYNYPATTESSTMSYSQGFPVGVLYPAASQSPSTPYPLQIPSSYSTLSGGLGDQSSTSSLASSSPSHSTIQPPCSCRSHPTINNTYNSLSQHLQSALYKIRQCAPPNHSDAHCALLKKVDELNKHIRGIEDGCDTHSWSYDNLSSAGTGTESEILTPLSTSSSHSQILVQSPCESIPSSTSSLRDWPYTTSGSNSAFSASYFPDESYLPPVRKSTLS